MVSLVDVPSGSIRFRTRSACLAGPGPVFGARAELHQADPVHPGFAPVRPGAEQGHPGVEANFSALAPRTSRPRNRTLVNVTGQLSGAGEGGSPESATLDALRAARRSREALQQRMLPFLVVIIGGVDYLSAKASPGIGLHGASLGLSVGLIGFTVGAVGLRQTMLRRRTSVRVYGPIFALMLVSSALLVWVQPTGPGAGGCIVAIAVAVAMRVIPVRIGSLLIVLAICGVSLLITETGGRPVHHGHSTGFLASVFSFTGVFLYAMVVWRFRQRDEQQRRLMIQLEETREAELRAAALAERQRLAREMHDVLAHSLSGLVVQLEGARLLAVSEAAGGRLAATIDRAHQLAKSGLEEARQAIGMLRDDDLPGPGKLAALARSFEADTGVPCRYTETGGPAELGSAVWLALYRVTQEALTNVRKHAHPERAEVRLEYRPAEVSLAIEDFAATTESPSPAAPPFSTVGGASGGGYGLTGMRERAELLGGSLTAGPTRHGFLVLLRVPAGPA
jgi:signal transduction histidine kinase